MDNKAKTRLKWIKLYQQKNNMNVVCDYYSISRTTLSKWFKRYQELGEIGLTELSRKPKNSPSKKRNEDNEKLIINLRSERKLGARRLQSELKRLYDISFSLSTIHKVLKNHNVADLKFKRNYRKKIRRYNCKIPGERIQMDVCKIANNLYQYTAIDDCTRYKVIGLFSRRASSNTLLFLAQLKERMPFSIQRIQTDRGKEFFAYEVQDYLMAMKIKFRPIKPASPHLNGKVERTQRTDLDEFYSSVSIKDPDLHLKLRGWEEYYNNHRSHSSLNGKTPLEKFKELENVTPSKEKIDKLYGLKKESIILQNYKHEQLMKPFR